MYGEAILRCFDIAINLPIPDEKTRKKIIEKYSNGLSTKRGRKKAFWVRFSRWPPYKRQPKRR